MLYKKTGIIYILCCQPLDRDDDACTGETSDPSVTGVREYPV